MHAVCTGWRILGGILASLTATLLLVGCLSSGWSMYNASEDKLELRYGLWWLCAAARYVPVEQAHTYAATIFGVYGDWFDNSTINELYQEFLDKIAEYNCMVIGNLESNTYIEACKVAHTSSRIDDTQWLVGTKVAIILGELCVVVAVVCFMSMVTCLKRFLWRLIGVQIILFTGAGFLSLLGTMIYADRHERTTEADWHLGYYLKITAAGGVLSVLTAIVLLVDLLTAPGCRVQPTEDTLSESDIYISENDPWGSGGYF